MEKYVYAINLSSNEAFVERIYDEQAVLKNPDYFPCLFISGNGRSKENAEIAAERLNAWLSKQSKNNM